MITAIKLIYLLKFYVPYLVNKEYRCGFHMGLSFGCTSIGRHLPHVDGVDAYLIWAVGNIFRRRGWRNVTDYCIGRLFRIREECKTVEIIFLRGGFYGRIVCHFLYYETGYISFISELLLSFDVFFWLESNEDCCRSDHYWWRPARFLGAFSDSAFFPPVVRVSMSVILRGRRIGELTLLLEAP